MAVERTLGIPCPANIHLFKVNNIRTLGKGVKYVQG